MDIQIKIDAPVREAAQALAAGPERRLLGLAGAPGAGKSTLAAALTAAMAGRAVNVPMDGFHLSQHQLERLGRAQRKGAPDTFDGNGYQALLQRLRTAPARDEIIYAPDFRREIEEPIAAGLAIPPDTPLIITEGNYLLLDVDPWTAVAAQLDAIWYLDVDTVRRENRLLQRHMRFGRTEAEARSWMTATDRPNATRVEASMGRADCILHWYDDCIRFAENPPTRA